MAMVGILKEERSCDLEIESNLTTGPVKSWMLSIIDV
jgi:hypothetical protein